MYKASTYNFYFNVKNEPYVYNILSTSIAKLDVDVSMKIETSPNEISQNILLSLAQEGFVVDEKLDEKKQYQFFYDSQRFGEGCKNLHLMFIPTYECNLRCPYCYEGMIKSHKIISSEEVDAILKFTERKLSNDGGDIEIEKIFVSLYGGEPMYNKSILIQFCNGISKVAEKYCVPIVFDMTSNFTMLDDSIIDLIKEYEINVQVSIDGSKKEHDKRRIHANGSGTYAKIIENLDKMYQRGLSDFVTIRLNIDQNNISDISEQLTILKKYSNDIYFGFLTKYSSNSDYCEDCIDSCDYSSLSSEVLHQLLDKQGLIVPQRFGKKAPCSMNSRNKYIIDCNLDVYKCELLVGKPHLRAGRLTLEGEFYKEPNYYDYITYSPFNSKKCQDCKLLPMCGAGCPSRKFLSIPDCDKPVSSFFDCCVSEADLDAYLKDYVNRIQSQ